MVAIFGGFKAEFSESGNFTICRGKADPASRCDRPAGFRLCAERGRDGGMSANAY